MRRAASWGDLYVPRGGGSVYRRAIRAITPVIQELIFITYATAYDSEPAAFCRIGLRKRKNRRLIPPLLLGWQMSNLPNAMSNLPWANPRQLPTASLYARWHYF